MNPFASNQTEGTEPTEDQKKAQYDALSPEQKKKQTYTEWVKEAYNNQYERWMPWIEDQYLKWFGKGDNKASYMTKGAAQFLFLSPPLSHLLPPPFRFKFLSLVTPRSYFPLLLSSSL